MPTWTPKELKERGRQLRRRKVLLQIEVDGKTAYLLRFYARTRNLSVAAVVMLLLQQIAPPLVDVFWQRVAHGHREPLRGWTIPKGRPSVTAGDDV